jgi:hypothetical protein
MHRRVVLSLAILLGLATAAHANLSINVGSHNLNPNQAGQVIFIEVTGGVNTQPIDTVNSISSHDSVLQLAGGGGGVGGPAPAGEPKLTEVNAVTGTIFDGNTADSPPGQVGFSSEQFWNVGVVNDGSPANFYPNPGVLLKVTIDTTGVTSGTFALIMDETNDVFNGYSSNYSNSPPEAGDLALDFDIINGSVTIVPEPSTVVLGLLAAAGLGLVAIRRRRARG